jgi:hypothetical protein
MAQINEFHGRTIADILEEIMTMIFKNYFDYAEMEELRDVSPEWNRIVEGIYYGKRFIVIYDYPNNRDTMLQPKNCFMVNINKYHIMDPENYDLMIIPRVIREFINVQSIRVYLSLTNRNYNVLLMLVNNFYSELLQEIVWHTPIFNINHELITRFCQKFPNIDHLELKSTKEFTITEESLSLMFKMLKELRVFELSGKQKEGIITGQCFEHLGPQIASLRGGSDIFTDTAFTHIANRAPNLTELDLGEDSISRISMGFISEKCKNLEILKFKMKKDNNENLMYATYKYCEYIGRLNMLEELSVQFPCVDTPILIDYKIVDSLRKCNKIKKLKMEYVWVNDESLTMIAEQFPRIECLDLYDVTFNMVENFEKMKTLNDIRFHECFTSDATIALMIKVCPNLKRCKISYCNALIETVTATIELANLYHDERIRVHMKSKELRKQVKDSAFDLKKIPKNLDAILIDDESFDDQSFSFSRKCMSKAKMY